MLPPLEEYLTGKTVMLPEVERAPVLTSAFTVNDVVVPTDLTM